MPLVILALSGAVLLSPVLVPYAFWQVGREQKRQVATALNFSCEACGQILGQASLDRAGAEHQAMIEQLHRDNPGVRFRLAERTVHAICANCEKRYAYDKAANTFVAEKVRRQRLMPTLLAPEESA